MGDGCLLDYRQYASMVTVTYLLRQNSQATVILRRVTNIALADLPGSAGETLPIWPDNSPVLFIRPPLIQI
jgi:hypothetical protein